MSGRLHLLDAGLPAPADGTFSTSRGGVSGDGHGGTNLSLRSGDEPRRTLANRDLLAREVDLRGSDLAFAEQVHGAAVAVLSGPPSARHRTSGARGADALVTDRSGTGLVVLAGDCMPVLLADPVAGVVGAAHAGRPGLLAGVLQATVAAMTGLGADPAHVVAVVGPCIGGCCYELPPAMVDGMEERMPGLASTTTWGTPSIDLRSGAEVALAQAGVETVRHVGGCTFEQPDLLYSYRRDATADRHGALVVVR